MEEYGSLLFRCVFFYFVITALLRLMGKREVGELSVFDIVVYFVMSELLAISISDPSESIFKTLVPIITLTVLQIFLSWIMMKFQWVRDLFDGRPAIMIRYGELDLKQMKKQRYTVEDLLSQLRIYGQMDIEKIQFAILENSGDLAVIEKEDTQIQWPEPLISDGRVQIHSLLAMGKDQAWLQQELKKKQVREAEVFLCLWRKDGLWIVRK
ncbi:MAG: DUF421 domain-containing protein [Erysipelotrichaceae bacterium]|nr:DUF421 domain-containing protein [Erysipelotrichaceae bacterium]